MTIPVFPPEEAIRTATSSPLTTTVVVGADGLSRYANVWDELLLQQPFPLPMSSSSWIQSHAECMLQANQEIVVIFAHQEERLVGVLPVVISKEKTLQSRNISVPCGLHTRSVDLILAPETAVQAMEVLLEELHRVRPRWQSLRLSTLSDQTRTSAAVEQLGNAIAWIEPAGRGAFVDTRGHYQDYIEGLSHNFARNIRRVRTRLKTDYLTEFQIVKTGSGATDLFKDFLKVEASGWKGAQGTAIKASPKLCEFYHNLTERLAQRGWLEYHRLLGDGRVMAAHLAIHYKRTVILLKIAYDEQYSSYAPGNMLMQEIIRRSFEDPDIDEINCLTDMVWNTNWKMTYHNYIDITMYPRRPLAMLTGYYPQVMKERLRKTGPVRSCYRWLKQFWHR